MSEAIISVAARGDTHGELGDLRVALAQKGLQFQLSGSRDVHGGVRGRRRVDRLVGGGSQKQRADSA